MYRKYHSKWPLWRFCHQLIQIIPVEIIGDTRSCYVLCWMIINGYTLIHFAKEVSFLSVILLRCWTMFSEYKCWCVVKINGCDVCQDTADLISGLDLCIMTLEYSLLRDLWGNRTTHPWFHSIAAAVLKHSLCFYKNKSVDLQEDHWTPRWRNVLM